MAQSKPPVEDKAIQPGERLPDPALTAFNGEPPEPAGAAATDAEAFEDPERDATPDLDMNDSYMDMTEQVCSSQECVDSRHTRSKETCVVAAARELWGHVHLLSQRSKTADSL